MAQNGTRRDAREARSRRQRGRVTIAKAIARVYAPRNRVVSTRRGRNRDVAESGPSGSAATTSSDVSTAAEESDPEASDDPATTDDDAEDSATSAVLGAGPRPRGLDDGGLQACHICGRTFALKSSVRRHLRNKHADEYLRLYYYVCESRSCVRRHLMNKHMGERLYQCAICEINFAQKVSLARHQVTHTRGKLHECSECGGEFVSERTLRVHQLTHARAKPHKCRLCPAAFARSDTLNCHLLTHTKERPYKCETCEARFSDRATLRRHRRTHGRQAVASDHPRSSGTCSPPYHSTGGRGGRRRTDAREREVQLPCVRQAFLSGGDIREPHRRTCRRKGVCLPRLSVHVRSSEPPGQTQAPALGQETV
ncbi:uncharacterized protein LOC142560298 isoform X2 [Dermacentor variabilis]|uniref:uncharacterized protein LOC142560298 isoform X2 n=1 Tax=Dermacentor variabilis TaxID=34621 RepID=UPI003F5B4256